MFKIIRAPLVSLFLNFSISFYKPAVKKCMGAPLASGVFLAADLWKECNVEIWNYVPLQGIALWGEKHENKCFHTRKAELTGKFLFITTSYITDKIVSIEISVDKLRNPQQKGELPYNSPGATPPF